jgi:hypothetical protein
MRTKISLLVVLTAIAVVAATASVASAGGRYRPLSNMSNCPAETIVQPFVAPWGDADSYFLAPGGSFEGNLTGWTVQGGRLVHGNESYYVDSSKDGESLSLPSGSRATSPSICVTTQTPDLRIFVLNTGSATATLNVNMTYTNIQGRGTTVSVGSLTGSSSWSLSPQVFFLKNITPVVNSNGQTWVTFSFAPVGRTGHWQIDDFYVDPIKSQRPGR